MMKSCFIALIAGMTVLGCNMEAGQPLKISSLEINAESVYLTHDNQGNPVVAWTEKSDEELVFYFSISNDDGRTFPDKIPVRLDERVATHGEGMPKIAFKGDGTILVAYETKSPTAENKYAGAICYITTKDGGRSWSSQRFIHRDTTAGRSRSYFDIATLPDGQVGASWLDIKLDAETGGRSVRFAKTDAEDSFTQEVLIDSSACQCCRTDIYTDTGRNVYVAYRGLRKGVMGKAIRDMMCSTSADEGKNFSSPITISVDNWNIDGCPHTGPSLCTSKAGLMSLWYTEGSGNGVYYTHKPIDSSEFLPRQLVSATGSHPQVCSNGDKIAMLWEEPVVENGKVVTKINYQLLNRGVPVQRDIISTSGANAFLPVVTQTNEGFLVAYLTEVDNRVNVYLARL